MQRFAFLLIICAALTAVLSGCEGHMAAVNRTADNFLVIHPQHTAMLKESLKRKADFIVSEIQGPLKNEIRNFLRYHVSQIGPLFYRSREFLEEQIEKAEIMPEIITKFLEHEVYDRYDDFIKELDRYGRRHTAEELPQLQESYRRFLRARKDELDSFITAVNRYERINTSMLKDLSISIDNFLSWQKESTKAVPDATKRYLARISSDFEEVMNTTGRMFDYNLSEKPLDLKRSLYEFAQFNSKEKLEELKKSTGKFFWENTDVSDLTKEVFCYLNGNLDRSQDLLSNVEKFFDINVEHANEVSKEFFRFLEWRFRQWHDMKVELNRYISSNVQNYERFLKSPLKYLRRQQEEWEILKETVPDYFLYNLGKAESVGFALKRYFRFNIHGSGNFR